MTSFSVHSGWRTVCGGILLHFVIGTMYNWGNIITYVTSYLRAYDPSISYKDTVKIYPVALAVHGVTLLFSGWVSKRVGYRNCCFLGSFIFVSATYLASVSTTFSELMLTQGIMFGLGMGLTYTVPISSGVQLLPQHQGVVSGLVVAGFGCGPFIFGALSSRFANPSNDHVDQDGQFASYYPPNSEVVANVPNMYRNLALIYTVVMFVGSMMVSEPDVNISRTTTSEKSNISTSGSRQYNPINAGLGVEADADVEESIEDVSSTTKTSTSIHNVNPLQMILLPLSWHMALCLALTGVGGLYLAVSSKVFAQHYFESDSFLTTVASTAALFNALGRIVWGVISDRYGPLATLTGMSVFFSFIIWYYPYTMTSEAFFAVWTFLVFFCEGSNFVLYIPLCIDCFGKDNATSNYAVLFLVVPIFNLVNIFLLADLEVDFVTTTTVLSAITFAGFVCLVSLSLHIRHSRNKSTA